jgi:hypothetical protein
MDTTREDYVIESVQQNDDGFDVFTNQGIAIFLEAHYNVFPRAGDQLTLYVIRGSEIAGIELNGQEVFFKTQQEVEQRHAEVVQEAQSQKMAQFEKKRDHLDGMYEKMPEIFRKRVDKFRANNSTFRQDFEEYELFCCTEAVKIADYCKTAENLKSFDNSQASVDVLAKGHTENSYGMSVRLAHAYLSEPESLLEIHGALSHKVGCVAYGCHTNAELREKQAPVEPQHQIEDAEVISEEKGPEEPKKRKRKPTEKQILTERAKELGVWKVSYNASRLKEVIAEAEKKEEQKDV